MYDYQDTLKQSFGSFTKLFKDSEALSEEQMETRWNNLLKEIPHFYFLTRNNCNFLFLEDFYYSPPLLSFLNKKIDLNFLSAPRAQSPLTFHLEAAIKRSSDPEVLKTFFNQHKNNYQFSDTELLRVQALGQRRDGGDDLFLILKEDTPHTIGFKQDALRHIFRNFFNFSGFEQNLDFYKENATWAQQHLITKLLGRIHWHVNAQYKPVAENKIDWIKTFQCVYNDTFKLDQYPTIEWQTSIGQEDSVDSPSTFLLEHMASLPWTPAGLANKTLFINYLAQRLHTPSPQANNLQQEVALDWSFKVQKQTLAYYCIFKLLIPNVSISLPNPTAWEEWMDNLIYKEILPQVSFQQIYSTHHGDHSLYDMLRKHWMPNYANATTSSAYHPRVHKYLNTLLEKGPLFEEKMKIEQQIDKVSASTAPILSTSKHKI